MISFSPCAALLRLYQKLFKELGKVDERQSKLQLRVCLRRY